MDKVLGIWKRKVRRVGHAYYIAIPTELIRASGINPGEPMTIQLISNGNIVIVNDSKKLEEEEK
jgi:bifunctional DNA-binding transcriptional regulator/antitoxin component of YhaV-PrlF toxin-antitoxin module